MGKVKVNKNTDALVIVDLQNDFCPGGSLAVPGGDRVVRVINNLVALFFDTSADAMGQCRVLFTKDWHKNDHDGWPLHCIRGTRGAEFHSDLVVPSNANIFVKGVRPHEGAYSGFDGYMMNPATQMPYGFGNDVSFQGWLETLETKRLFVVGLATDYCVKATVLDGLKLGFEVVVIEDGIRAVNVNPDDGKKAIQEMKDAGARFVESRQLSS